MEPQIEYNRVNRLLLFAPLGTGGGFAISTQYPDWDTPETLLLGVDETCFMKSQLELFNQINKQRLGFEYVTNCNYAHIDEMELKNKLFDTDNINRRVIVDEFHIFQKKFPEITKAIISSNIDFVFLTRNDKNLQENFHPYRLRQFNQDALVLEAMDKYCIDYVSISSWFYRSERQKWFKILEG